MSVLPQQIQRLIPSLKSKTEEERNRAAKELFQIVSSDLREVPAEKLSKILEQLTQDMLNNVKGDTAAKLGGILTIVVLINALDIIDVCKTDARITRFGNYLCQTCLNGSSDQLVIQLAAKALARLTQVSGTYTTNLVAQIVCHQVKRAFENLLPINNAGQFLPLNDRDEVNKFEKRYSSVLVLREIACCMPSFFFQNASQFYNVIFNAIWAHRIDLRKSAVHALRAGLIVTVQREPTKQAKQYHKEWYEKCYFAVIDGLPKLASLSGDQNLSNRTLYTSNKDMNNQFHDKIHGSLLILAELLRCCNEVWERSNNNIEEKIIQGEKFMEQSFSSSTNRNTSYPDKLKGGFNAVKRYYQSGFSRQPTSIDYSLMEYSRNRGTKAPSLPFHWFGTTIIGREQIVESTLLRTLMNEHYDEICEIVIAITKHPTISRNSNVQNSLLLVLPKLACFKREIFVLKYLQEAISYMDKILLIKDRYNAYLGIGLLAVAVGHEMQPYLENVMQNIRQNLPSKPMTNKRRQNSHLEPAIFACISMVVSAVKHHLEPNINEIIDSMLYAGLSPSLTNALYEIAQNIPPLKISIAEGLLKILSLILMQRPYHHPGTPKCQIKAQPSIILCDSPDTALIVLGLRTLSSFDFQGHSLLYFIRYCADNYLQSEVKSIRQEAVTACASLLERTLLELAGRNSQTVVTTIYEVLGKLLVLGISDRNADIRYCVINSLNECYDEYLAQPENLAALFAALNDEQFEIRELTMCIIARMSTMNPAIVKPLLRKTLIQLLTQIENSGIGRNKEQSARIIERLVVNAPKFIRPYAHSIMSVLIPKLKETAQSTIVISSYLRVIGELAQVAGNLMKNYINELLPILQDILNNSSSTQKRETLILTFSHIIAATGTVVKPYHHFPNLLDTLIGFLRTEQRQSIRRKTLRLLGLLGALDPYKHKLNIGQIDSACVQSASLIPINDSISELEQSFEVNPSEMLVTMWPSTLEDFYTSVAIATLTKILRDYTLFRHHKEAVTAITRIFNAIGIKSIDFISWVIPSMLKAIRLSDNHNDKLNPIDFRDFLFQQLGNVINIVQLHVKKYANDIVDLINEFWTIDSPCQLTIIHLVENVAEALGSDFKVYLPNLIPQILKTLMNDSSLGRQVTGKLLLILENLGSRLSDYIHLIIPQIVILFDSSEVPERIRCKALECIDGLTESLDLSDYVSTILHPLARCLDTAPNLRPQAMDTLASFVLQLGKKYTMFVPMIQKILDKERINHKRYELLYTYVMESNEVFNSPESTILHPSRRKRENSDSARSKEQSPASASSMQREVRKLPVNPEELRKAWGVCTRGNKDDWLEWYNGLCHELLKVSPSPALRACYTVAQGYSQLAKDLFNASFVSVWSELTYNQQEELMGSLEQALTVPDLPEISQTILNLAEFMEHCDKGPLPLDPVLLGEQAMKCRAYAKALHYKEDEFIRQPPTVPVLEALISINNKLGQKEAAMGLLEWGSKHLSGDLPVQERWFEKLNNWEKALEGYRQKAEEKPDDPELILSRMRCLEALGEWGEVYDISERYWDKVATETKHKMAKMATTAAWGKQEWNSMYKYTNLLPRESQDGAFYRAVLHVHQGQWRPAQELIELTRDMLDTEITALSLESYQRAYPTMVCIQMLAELEEVIEYKLMPERRTVIREMWWQRLQGCQRAVEDWQRILQLRSLVLTPQDDQRTWLKYASLCRKSGRLQLAHKTLVNILGSDPCDNLDSPLPVRHPQATFAFTKQLWAMTGDRMQEKAFKHLQNFVRRTLQPKCVVLSQEASKDDNYKEEERECSQLLARCYLKLGQWQETLQGVNESSIPAILQYYAASTEHDNTWYKAWHAWAVMNFETCLFFRHQQQQQGPQISPNTSTSTTQIISPESNSSSVAVQGGLSPQMISTYAVPALKGFVRSINLSKGNSLQDTLRLLTLLFDYGHQNDMYEALHEGVRTIEIDNWLQVIPQLIARIDTPRPLVGRLIHQLLADVGRFHPQALVYSLTVACKSNVPARRNAANKILNKMREHSDSLVGQSMMVSEELIRVAILWHEQWHEGLEDASRLYFGERNIQGMLAKLEPLHAMMEKGPQTLKETSFVQAYGNDLLEAKRWCQRYHMSLNIRDLNQAWDLYYHVFRRISRQLPQLIQLELQYVSPKLLMSRDLELAVPGSYTPNSELIQISKVDPSLQVITSKQRPRKLMIKGSNGKTFMFLLKGHEDLRQDERVMQFFSLVNSLLLNDPETFRRNLAIQRFAVIPLSTNSGLIGWVPHSDTLHALIKDYREKKKILLNIEHRIMQRMTPDYDHLPLMNKVEVFEHSLEHTQGDDLAKLLLLKSPSSEVWFERRTNFTRSLAVMSMVGYVLGLGDRHPSNLLLDKNNGKILHIDFGDCFEVAMTREKFPEKIPFRLTRMLIKAMEVTGIEGTYRCTCESVMSVLRNNKDSLLAVLEAFVYDPLLNWRLIETGPKGKKSKDGQAGTSSTTQPQAPGAATNNSTSNQSGVGAAIGAPLLTDNAVLDPLGEVPAVPEGTVPLGSDETITGGSGLESGKNTLTASRVTSGGHTSGHNTVQNEHPPEALNKKALDIIHRVRDKLTGRDFDPKECLDVKKQVDYLILQATSNENLCQCYIGWCPFW